MAEYPHGKLNERDEGQTEMAVMTEGNAVVVLFKMPVSWIGFSADGARELAQLLIKNADKLEGK